MEENQSILDLQVDAAASKNLSDFARWAKFLAIVGFVCMALMLIFFISMQAQIASALSTFIPGLGATEGFGLILTTIIIIAAIVGLLMYFLLKSSTLIKRGLETRNQQVFNNGLSSLKVYFIIYGILAIVGLLINIVSIIQ